MLNAIVNFSIIIANLGGVLGLSGLLMLNYVFPSAAEGCLSIVKIRRRSKCNVPGWG